MLKNVNSLNEFLEYFKIEINIDMANTYNNIDITSIYDVSKKIIDIIKQNYSNALSPNSKLANFNWNVEWQDGIYSLNLILPTEWYWVEHGRKPSTKMPPVSKIEEWVKTHLGTTRLVPRGVNGKSVTRNTKQIAFAISKKIQREGFYSPGHQGKHIIEKSLNESSSIILEISRIITNKLSAVVNEEILTIFDDLDSFSNVSLK